MAQQMTMFKTASASFTAVRPSKAQRTSAVVVRAGAYDEELVQTAVSLFCMIRPHPNECFVECGKPS